MPKIVGHSKQRETLLARIAATLLTGEVVGCQGVGGLSRRQL
jgi:hypothetical protein